MERIIIGPSLARNLLISLFIMPKLFGLITRLVLVTNNYRASLRKAAGGYINEHRTGPKQRQKQNTLYAGLRWT